MANLASLAHRLDPAKQTCRAVIECQKGGRAKYSYDRAAEALELSRFLPEGMTFPLDFGFVPSTTGGDGDPLDIMVLADEPLAPGAILEVRLIGVIEAEQTEDGRTQRNDRLVAVATASRLFEKVARLEDVGEAFTRNLTQFWIHYETLRGVEFRVLAVRDAAWAASLISEAQAG